MALPFVGAAMVAYGAARLFCEKSSIPEVCAAFLLSGLGVLACSAFVGFEVSDVVFGVIDCVVAFILAQAVWARRAGITFDYIVSACVAAVMAGVVALQSYVSGISLTNALDSIFAQVFEQFSAVYGLEAATQIQGMLPLLGLLIPFGFFCLALIVVCASHLGGYLAVGKQIKTTWNFAEFDAPVWSMIVLVVSALACAVGVWWQPALGAGLSTIAALRFIFMLQGFSVLFWWLNKAKLGCILRFLVIFLAVDLELSLFVLSIVGVIDFFVNFRHLSRDKKKRAKQEKAKVASR